MGDGNDGDAGGDAPVDIGELVVERAMNRGHDRQVGVPLGVDRSQHGVVVDDVEALGGVVGGHHVAQLGDGDPDPKSFGLVEDPPGRYWRGRVSGREQHHFVARGLKTACQLVDY